MKEIILGCDHAGLTLGEFIQSLLSSDQTRLTFCKPPTGTRVDYPDYAKEVCNKLLASSMPKDTRGILVCGSGIGMSIACNKIPGVRAALCTDAYMAKMARLHNDANVLCLGQNVVGFGVAQSIVEAFLQTKFEGGRHAIRVQKLERMNTC
ncbi:ribose 5-phosphate isomerase B [Helicobacter cynogastricus]|uniref:ribose 5-phosphate isomerase B n=1 Tax=Helicobacter cynogastricus TaxID=329937 RepID=UPI000CF1BACC|nr:ribose 5-phosphate isomerase B [Helicobacter cynogastricus]